MAPPVKNLHSDFDNESDLHADFDAEPSGAPGPVPAPQEAPAPVTLGAGTTGAVHAARHLSFGLGDKITAAVMALRDLRQDKTGKTFGQIYANNLAFNDRLMEDSDRAHAVARWVGNGIGFGGNLAALAGVAPIRAGLAARGLVPAATRALAAPSIFGRAVQGAGEGLRTGAPLGAVGGFGASRGDSSVRDTLFGAGFGGLTGGVLGGAGGGLAAKWAPRTQPTTAPSVTLADLARETNQSLPMVARGVVPDAEAQVLQRYGVPITLGQMQPGGVASEAEEAARRVPFLGKAIEGQHKAAEQGWRDAVINTTRGPVEGPVGPGGAMEKLQRIKRDFSTAYEQIAERPSAALAVHPETGEMVHPREAFKAILSDPSYLAGGDETGAVTRLLEGQLSKMERLQSSGEPIKARVLMDMRSAIREAEQSARLSDRPSIADMLHDAAESMTGGIRSTLPARDVALLNQTDTAYSKFAKVVGATLRAGRNVEEGEFGPSQLKSELIASYGRKFATDPNAGGDLRELARAGKYAFTPRDPLTGHGERLKGALGLALGPQVFRANADPAAQNLFMLAAQRAAQSGPRSMPPAASEIERLLGSLLGRTPTATASISPGVASLQDLLNGGRQ